MKNAPGFALADILQPDDDDGPPPPRLPPFPPPRRSPPASPRPLAPLQPGRGCGRLPGMAALLAGAGREGAEPAPKRRRTSGGDPGSADGAPAGTGSGSPEADGPGNGTRLEVWVSRALGLRKRGVDFVTELRRNARFDDPSLLARTVAGAGVDEHATCLPWDGGGVAEGYYDVLKARQDKTYEP